MIYRCVVEKSVTDVFAYWVPHKKTVTPRKVTTIQLNVPRKIGATSCALAVTNKFVGADPSSKKIDSMKNFIELLNLEPFSKSVSYSLFVASDNNEIEERHNHVDDDFRPLINMKCLKTIYNSSYETLTLDELVKIGEDLDFHLLPADIAAIQQQSVEQANSVEWKDFRMGRITAPNTKAACSARNGLISMSALKKICHPKHFITTATKWGIDNEQVCNTVQSL